MKPSVSSEFVQALGGEVGGQVEEDGSWHCACGTVGKASSYVVGGLMLYRHRRTEHTLDKK